MTPGEEWEEIGKRDVDSKRMTPAKKENADESRSQGRDAVLYF